MLKFEEGTCLLLLQLYWNVVLLESIQNMHQMKSMDDLFPNYYFFVARLCAILSVRAKCVNSFRIGNKLN